MESKKEALKHYEDEIENALLSLELSGQLNKALAVYCTVEKGIEAVESSPGDPFYVEKQRVLAYCLMRQVNILLQQGQLEEALALSERELTAACASGDEVTLGRGLMSHGSTCIVNGNTKEGMTFIEKARPYFERGTTYDHAQGLGWYWILKADLQNAEMIPGNPSDVIHACDTALDILMPIKNWPGVARAYAARAHAYEKLGNHEKAAADRNAQSEYEKIASEEGIGSP
ncbi:MAG: hypothetical protein AYK18_10780 [Theionarchaea archaeon DG-70]|nr:MAG: hypothetical protein AYK18_10780 [Theionarchaea archaeon DG-70]